MALMSNASADSPCLCFDTARLSAVHLVGERYFRWVFGAFLFSNHVPQQFNGEGHKRNPGDRKSHGARLEHAEATDVDHRMGGTRIEKHG
ncbi:MAG: hypothetical protein EPO47_03600, partial [Rugosibacter sp.]